MKLPEDFTERIEKTRRVLRAVEMLDDLAANLRRVCSGGFTRGQLTEAVRSFGAAGVKW